MKKIFLIGAILLSVSINAQSKDYILVQNETNIIGFLSSRIGLVFTTQLDDNMMRKISDEMDQKDYRVRLNWDYKNFVHEEIYYCFDNSGNLLSTQSLDATTLTYTKSNKENAPILLLKDIHVDTRGDHLQRAGRYKNASIAILFGSGTTAYALIAADPINGPTASIIAVAGGIASLGLNIAGNMELIAAGNGTCRP